MCDCINVRIGSYDNQVILDKPIWSSKEKGICVDRCLESEIKELWDKGIITTGCCCGHNVKPELAYIGVENEFIEKMKSMGYEVAYNPSRPNDEDSFTPKTLN